MGLPEELLGDLAKVVDEADGGVALEGVLDGEDVDVALVKEVVEDVDGLGGGRALSDRRRPRCSGIHSYFLARNIDI